MFPLWGAGCPLYSLLLQFQIFCFPSRFPLSVCHCWGDCVLLSIAQVSTWALDQASLVLLALLISLSFPLRSSLSWLVVFTPLSCTLYSKGVYPFKNRGSLSFLTLSMEDLKRDYLLISLFHVHLGLLMLFSNSLQQTRALAYFSSRAERWWWRKPISSSLHSVASFASCRTAFSLLVSSSVTDSFFCMFVFLSRSSCLSPLKDSGPWCLLWSSTFPLCLFFHAPSLSLCPLSSC